MLTGGFEHEQPHEVVGDDPQVDFLFDHRRGLRAQHIESEGGLDVADPFSDSEGTRPDPYIFPHIPHSHPDNFSALWPHWNRRHDVTQFVNLTS